MIYAQFGLLYEIIPNDPHSSFDPKVNPSVGVGPRSYRKSCYIGTRKSKERVLEVAEKRAQPLHLRER